MSAGEFQLIQRYLSAFGSAPQVRLGVGDDAAILTVPAGHELLVSTDTIVTGVHFPENTFPEHIASRAVATAASDLAAMAGEPLAMTLALTLPDSDELWLHSFSQGLARAVTRCQLPLVGGDLTRGPLSVTVTVHGAVPRDQAVRRTGAKPGDRLCVTHTLGNAAAGLALVEGRLAHADRLTEDHELFLERCFYEPSPRLEEAQWLRQWAHAAIDISDGLLADADHLAAASGLGCLVDAHLLPLAPALQRLPPDVAIPLALQGGDDYELAIAVPADIELPGHLTCVGWFESGEGLRCDYPSLIGSGYDHFGPRAS